MKNYYVYIMASRSRVLYVGVTNNLVGRLVEHRSDQVPGFSNRYQTHRLVYYEVESDVTIAIEREKQIKRWRREKKIALIERMNPGWEDLSETLLESGYTY